MHGTHLSIASVTLFLWTGTMIVAGSACVVSSQVQALGDFLKDRGRHRHRG